MTPAEANVRRFRQATAQQKLCGQCLPDSTAKNRWQLLELAIAHVGPTTPLTLLEFGVAKGQSLSLFTKRFVNSESRFVGFDSFYGLPEDWIPNATIAKGTFSTDGELPRIADPRIQYVKGWFQNTVPEFLRTPTVNLARTVLIHYDSDLYSSTLFLLTTVWHFVSEYFFIMDDFAFDEVVALHDFSNAYPVTIEWLAKRSNPQGTPVQMFGRMRRIPFRVD